MEGDLKRAIVESQRQQDPQFVAAREAAPAVKDWWNSMDTIDKATIVPEFIPGIGDVIGVGNDIRHWYKDTISPGGKPWGWPEYALAGGAATLPFVPSAIRGLKKRLKGAPVAAAEAVGGATPSIGYPDENSIPSIDYLSHGDTFGTIRNMATRAQTWGRPLRTYTDVDGKPFTTMFPVGVPHSDGTQYLFDPDHQERLSRILADEFFPSRNLSLHQAAGLTQLQDFTYDPVRRGGRMRISIDTKVPPDPRHPFRYQVLGHELSHGVVERGGLVDALKKLPPAEADLIREEMRQASQQISRPGHWRGLNERLAADPTDQDMLRTQDYMNEDDELFADAGLAYQASANRFRALAPNAARFMRSIVNNDPHLGKFVGFGSLAGTLGAKDMLRSYDEDPDTIVRRPEDEW